MNRKTSSSLAAIVFVFAALSVTATHAQTPPKSKAAGKSTDREQFKKDSSAKAEPELPAELLAIADRVQAGRIACELGHNVGVIADEKSPGYFTITNGTQRYRLIPVPTTTGAIRLEDKARGGVWLQLANKSMLLDEKNGKRLADDCQSTTQRQFAEMMKTTPPASVLDAAPAK